MLLFLLACSRDEHVIEADACTRDDDPPGDPVYRSCVVTAHGTWPGEWRTDAEGRTVAHTTTSGTWTWDRTYDGACEVRTETTCARADGTSCGSSVVTRACDSLGNPTRETTVETDGDDVDTWTVDYAYTYDEAGHALVTVATGDTATTTTTCAWSDAPDPDTCVNDRATTDPTDDLTRTWAYDGDGLVVAYREVSGDPGWIDEQSWVRGLYGHTLTWETSDTVSGEHCTYDYTYDGRAVATRAGTCGMSGPVETTYQYERWE